MEGILQGVVGANIRRVRTQQGLSQEAFGESVGWHRTFVGAVERGERNLTLKTVERISDQLGIHPLDLLWDRTSVGLQVDTSGVARPDPTPAPRLRAADDPGAVGAGDADAPRDPSTRRRPRPAP